MMNTQYYTNIRLLWIISCLALGLGMLNPVQGVRAANPAPVQTYYIPIPEKDFLASLNRINSIAKSPFKDYVSIVATLDNTVIYYDQHENGYDVDSANLLPNSVYSAANPAGTQTWGDGNAANGCAPYKKYAGVTTTVCTDANDKIDAGAVIILDTSIDLNQPAIQYDAQDKVSASKPLAVTRTGWAAGAGSLLAGSAEVLDTKSWGTSYILPVGSNSIYSNTAGVILPSIFQYTGLHIMAKTNGTTVVVDCDGPETVNTPITFAIGEGESKLIDNLTTDCTNGAKYGATIESTNPVQVNLIAGIINSRYRADAYTILPKSAWSNSYFSPVGTSSSYTTRIFLYNPNSREVDVSCEINATIQRLTIIPGGTAIFIVPEGVGAHCYAPEGVTFSALSAVDTSSSTSSSYDWGFTLIPQDQLTSQGVVGWGPGRDPTSTVSPDENGSPIWVMPICDPRGGILTRETTYIYADWNNDGQPDKIDLNGNGNVTDVVNGIDESTTNIGIPVVERRSIKLFNPAGDQTGAFIYSMNSQNNTGSTGCRMAIAWGADPGKASLGAPGIDVGTTIPPLPILFGAKSGNLYEDVDGDGVASPGDVYEYTIVAQNTGRVPLGGIIITDTLPALVTYIPGTTTQVIISPTDRITSTVTDAVAGDFFPLGQAGPGLRPPPIPVRGSVEAHFRVRINSNLQACNGFINLGRIKGDGIVIDVDHTARICKPTIDKFATPAIASPGSQITYTLNYTIAGPSSITEVQISDALPAGLSYVAGSWKATSGPNPTSFAANGQNLVWKFDQVQPQIIGSIVFLGLVDPAAQIGLQLVNRVIITDNVGYIDPGVVTNTVGGEHGLLLQKSVNPPGPVAPADTLVYSLRWTVTGTQPAPNVIVSDPIPENTVFVSCSNNCSNSGNKVTWSLGTLDARGVDLSGVLQFTVTVPITTPNGFEIVNTAVIGDDMKPPTPSTVTTTVNSQHTLAIQKTSSAQGVIGPNELITYTLAYSVAGNGIAQGVQIRDVLPSQVSHVSCTDALTCTHNNGVITWDLGDVVPPANGTVIAVVRTGPGPFGTPGVSLVNTAAISDATVPPVSSTVTNTAVSTHTLQLQKTATPAGAVGAGEVITYRIAYGVIGNETAVGVVIMDKVPENTDYLSCSGGLSCAQVAGKTTWRLGDVPVGANGFVEMIVRVKTPLLPGLTIENRAMISDATTPPVEAVVTNTVSTAHTLTIQKTSSTQDVLVPNTLITYTIAYTALGNEIGRNAQINDKLPDQVVYVSCSGGLQCSYNNGTVTWDLGDLLPPERKSVTVVVRTGPGPFGTPGVALLNSAVISDATAPPARSTITNTVASTHTLQLQKTATPDGIVAAGAQIVYKLAYTVLGNESALGAVIADPVPTNTEYLSCSGGASCGLAGGIVTWKLGNVPAGTSSSVEMRVRVKSPILPGLSIVNHATFSDTTTPPAEAVVTNTVSTSHTFSILKTSSAPNPLTPNTLFTYTIAYTLTGNEIVQNVPILDELPEQVTYISCTGGVTCAHNKGVVTWNMGDLAPPTQGAVNVVVRTGPGPFGRPGVLLVNSAFIPDPNGVPVRSTVTDTVASYHDLKIEKKSTPSGEISAGMLITYKIEYAVIGNETAMGAVIEDVLPTNVSYVSCTGGISCAFAGGKVTWQLGNVPADTSGSAQLVARVLPNLIQPGTLIVNQATIKDDAKPPVSSTVTNTVALNHGLQILKSVTPNKPVSEGDDLFYSIAYTVTGGETAYDVTIIDQVPENTAFLSCGGGNGCALGGAPQTVTWKLGNLPAGTTGTVLLIVRVKTGTYAPGALITNVAVIRDALLPPVSSTVTTQYGTPQLTLVKTDGNVPAFPGTPLAYTLTVSNTGNATASTIVITERVPANTTFVAAGSSKWSCADGSPAGTVCLYVGGPLAINQSARVYFVVRVVNTAASGVLITNTAIAGGPGLPETPPATTSTPVYAIDLKVTITDLLTQTVADKNSTYTITVTNIGSYTATNVVLTTTMPPTVVGFVSASDAPKVSNGVIVWPAVPAVGPGQTYQRTVTIRTILPPLDVIRTITAPASVRDDGTHGPDAAPANNDDVDVTEINAVEPPKAVALARFEATRDAQGNAKIIWETTSEMDTMNFQVLRMQGTHTADQVLANGHLVAGGIPAIGPTGGQYQHTDSGLQASANYSYYLVETELSGKQIVYGPINVSRRAGPVLIYLPAVSTSP